MYIIKNVNDYYVSNFFEETEKESVGEKLYKITESRILNLPRLSNWGVFSIYLLRQARKGTIKCLKR